MRITQFVPNPNRDTPLAVWITEGDIATVEINSIWVVGFAVCDDGRVRGVICHDDLRFADTLPNFQGYALNQTDINKLAQVMNTEIEGMK